ncbi:MFS transporter [Arthrobacter sp. Marseille-P9274]|uniref:MFS transporter n=1 Tax=Arthrobacter sp. Marseille-P9274 TaxID=2866572 RepID=UPI0021C77A59|nr:MFS transporter [Arthrobacter sp. Marseille-P9274]
MPKTDLSTSQSTSDNPDSRGRIAFIVLFSSVVSTLLLMAPAVAGQLQAQMGLSPTQTGDLFAVELGAMSIASLPALFWIKRLNLRMASLVFALIFVTGNIVSSYANTYELLVTVRGATSLAGGSLMVLAMSLAARTANRERVYGLWTAGQIAFGAIGLAIFPRFFDGFGISVVYWTLAVLMILVLPLLRFLPSHSMPPAKAIHGGTIKPNLRKTVLGLIACLVFSIGLSSIWTFLGGIAGSAKIDPQTLGIILSVATMVGVVGSVAATLIGGKVNRRILLVGGHAGMLLAVALLFGFPSALQLATAAIIFKFAWPWTLPFLLSTLADLDRVGRASNLSNLFIGGGFAIGPFIAGRLVEGTGGYTALTLMSVLALLASLVLILFAQPSKRLADTPIPAEPVKAGA